MALDKDDIKQLIAILQKGLSDEDEDDTIEPPAKKKVSTKKKKITKPNLFEKMSESSMHKDDVEIDRRLRKLPPTERSRSYKPLKVRCRVCNREENVNPSLVESVERYKCNKCSTSAG
jgi:hypothetical protein